MTGMRTMRGGCHCGAVRYEAEADPAGAVECNCSYCAKKGFVLAFTGAENFRLLAGEAKLVEYRFNRHVIAHRFCRDCGTQPFSFGTGPDGKPMAAINLRCVDGIDLDALQPKKFDGLRL